ncbi:MAG: glycoside hydrolase family 88 protein [Spirochaetales bacterium]
MKNLPTEFVLEPLTNPTRFSRGPGLTSSALDRAISKALKTVKANIARFPAGSYPPPASTGQVYTPIANTEWTSSFWTGQLWLAYELTGEKRYLTAAQSHLPDYRRRLDTRTAIDTQDLGFLYSLSAVAEFKLTGNPEARATALKAADLLMVRYFEKAGVIQAWGDLNDPVNKGRIIIDCAMNMPLLFWASEQTGNLYYREAAAAHLAQANRYLIRPDASSFHTYFFNTESGEPLRGKTAQGYADDSCWARGQAWGILGLPLSFRYHDDPAYLETARKLAHYFLNRLPEDFVCYWDLCFTSGPEERDSSGAAIAACGLLELAKALPATDPWRRTYEDAALKIVGSLAKNYTADLPASNGLLLHGVYSKPGKAGVDECQAWGDYFYLEALVRLKKSWKAYW